MIKGEVEAAALVALVAGEAPSLEVLAIMEDTAMDTVALEVTLFLGLRLEVSWEVDASV